MAILNLKNVTGGKVDLQGGTVDAVQILGRTFNPPLVLTNGTINGLAIRKSANIVIEADVVAPSVAMVVGRPAALYAGDSTNIVVSGANVSGRLDVPVGRQTDNGSCIYLERVSGFEVLDADLHDATFGIQVVLSKLGKLLRSDLHNNKVDMSRFISCSDMDIGFCLFTLWRSLNVSGVGDHTDAFQIFNYYNQLSTPNRNFDFHDNLIWQADGAPAQGAFIQMQGGWARPENINVRRNIIIGGLPNGIVHPGTGVVEDNIVAHVEGSPPTRLMWSGSASKIVRNKATAFSDSDSDSGTGKDIGFNTPVPPTCEKIAPLTKSEEKALVDGWLAKFRGATPAPAPTPEPAPVPAPVSAPVPVDPAPAPAPVEETPPVADPVPAPVDPTPAIAVSNAALAELKTLRDGLTVWIDTYGG